MKLFVIGLPALRALFKFFQRVNLVNKDIYVFALINKVITGAGIS